MYIVTEVQYGPIVYGGCITDLHNVDPYQGNEWDFISNMIRIINFTCGCPVGGVCTVPFTSIPK